MELEKRKGNVLYIPDSLEWQVHSLKGKRIRKTWKPAICEIGNMRLRSRSLPMCDEARGE